MTPRPGFVLGLMLLVAACGDDEAATSDTVASDTAADAADSSDVVVLPACAARDPLRQAFFGDLHVHTARSLDAGLQGTRLTPRDAYRFAKGEQVGIQPHDAAGDPTRMVQLARPLDFAAVTDHAEFLGALSVCQSPGLPGHDHPQCKRLRDNPDTAFIELNFHTAYQQDSVEPPALCGDAGENCVEPTRTIWREIQDAADAFYDRTEACSLTTFVGYEWSANPLTANLHRNVIFASDVVPDLPTSYLEAPYADQLWAALRRDCLNAGTGCQVMAIPHNTNLSTGRYFDKRTSGGPLDAALAAEQAALEPLIEIMQHKGSSECHPQGPAADELCAFEFVPYNSLANANLDLDSDPYQRDFVRPALGEGLAMLQQLGVNPWAFGFIASTDTHLGTPGLVSETGFPGHGGAGASNRDVLQPGLPDAVAFNPGGLAGVWAEENRREAIFAALARKETFGTSGPRIAVRFFAGWGLDAGLCAAADFVQQGYDGGVPMGGTLPAAPVGATAPTFSVFAAKDPGVSSAPGTPLQRIQIIKGWRADDALQLTVIDVAGGANGAAVDLATCTPTGAGADELCATWTDPDFDATAPAFYYARVLENPTCRWSTRQCLAAGVDCADAITITEGFEGCCDDRFEQVVQERAWTSPIWFTP